MMTFLNLWESGWNFYRISQSPALNCLDRGWGVGWGITWERVMSLENFLFLCRLFISENTDWKWGSYFDWKYWLKIYLRYYLKFQAWWEGGSLGHNLERACLGFLEYFLFLWRIFTFLVFWKCWSYFDWKYWLKIHFRYHLKFSGWWVGGSLGNLEWACLGYLKNFCVLSSSFVLWKWRSYFDLENTDWKYTLGIDNTFSFHTLIYYSFAESFLFVYQNKSSTSDENADVDKFGQLSLVKYRIHEKTFLGLYHIFKIFSKVNLLIGGQKVESACLFYPLSAASLVLCRLEKKSPPDVKLGPRPPAWNVANKLF